MSVYELDVALDTTQKIIIELEKKMSTQKDDITVLFEKAVRIVENLHREEMEKFLQT